MTYSQFKSMVIDHLALDGQRQNIASFRDRKIKEGVRELTRYIPALRLEVIDKYSVGGIGGFKGVTNRNNVSIGATTSESSFSQAWVVVRPEDQPITVDPGDGDPIRKPVYEFPWAARADLEHSQIVGGSRKKAYMAIGPTGSFYLYPYLLPNEYLELRHRPISVDWEDGNQVPYGEDEAEAVANYVKAKLRMEIDGRDGMKAFENYMYLFRQRRTELYLFYKDRNQIDHPPSSTPVGTPAEEIPINNQ